MRTFYSQHEIHIDSAEDVAAEEAGLQREVAVVKLGSPPTAASFSPNGDLLIVGDADGRIHFVLSSGTLLFTQDIFGSQGRGKSKKKRKESE